MHIFTVPLRWLHSIPFGNAFSLLIFIILSGCSSEHYYINQRLPQPHSDTGYALRNLAASGNSDSLLVFVSFSGGGYRAAALAYGVLEELAFQSIYWEGSEKRLLDEVDFIASVSGGSITAAYYVLYRDRIFHDFETRVLEQDLQSILIRRVLSPRGLWRQTSPRLGRSDILQEILDEEIFSKKTFGDIPMSRPMLFISATEMTHGERFEFSQDQFDFICSDLSSFPISRAVAASMSAPIILSPITIWNYAQSCPWHGRPLPLKSRVETQSFIHLLDGGLSDNTGVTTPLEVIEARGGLIGSARASRLRGIKKRVFIVVNAQTNPEFEADASPDTPGLYRQFRALIDIPINVYSNVTVNQLWAAVERWKRELKDVYPEALEGILSRDTEFYIVEVNLSAALGTEQGLRALQDIPTGLRLTSEDISALKAFGRAELQKNSEWRRLMEELKRR
jgi:NTE family protein